MESLKDPAEGDRPVPRVVALVLLVCALAGFAPADGQRDEPPPPRPAIESLIADLGHPAYAVREKAQRELWQRGDAAVSSLEKALQDENPEVVRRSRELLDKFSWGIRPDSPPEVLRLLRQFQAGDSDPRKSVETRRHTVLELIQLGAPGLSVARALLGKDFPPELKEQLADRVTELVRRELPRRLFDGKIDEAAELVELHTAGTGPAGAADFTVFQILRETLPEAISSAEMALKAGKQAAHQKFLLAHLYRAKGDWAKARALAADLPAHEDAPAPLAFLREEEGDWGALADSLNYGGMNHPEAVRLTIQRLAGRDKDFNDTARRLIREAGDLSAPEEVFDVAVALFANHRAAEATRLLLVHKQNLALLTEILIAQLRYQEALALVANPSDISPDEILAFDIRRARALQVTGRRDEAVQLLSAVAGRLRKNMPDLRSASFRFISAVRSLLRTEMRLGFKDLAAEHAAFFVTDSVFEYHEHSTSGETAFEILLGPDSAAAESLFHALQRRKLPVAEAGPALIRVRELLSGKADPSAVDEALKSLPNDEEAEAIRGQYRQNRSATPGWALDSTIRLARATVCRAAGRNADAEAAYKEAAERAGDGAMTGERTWVFGVTDAHRPFVEWGEFLFSLGRYDESAATFLEGWKRFPDQPLPLFLSGKALAKAGNAKEAVRRIELSHWMALGQERIRGKFLDELVRRGEATAARREIDLILRGCWCRDHYFGNVMNQSAQAAVLNGDFATAEKCRQRSLLVILRTPDVFFVELAGYMNVPHDLLVYRARARLAAGKVDEAMALARDVLAVTPGHVDLVSGMVPELERLGKKEQANELFDRAWSAYQKVLTDYPAGNFARHALASLAANCRRELDAGLSYATEAAKAEPQSIPYREALAELLFIRGDRASALELMSKLVAESPRNHLFKRQLARYRSGSFESPRPDRAD
jgi:tetratricopeptide (TPR) repeat protein